jgi:UDP-N-acetyl-2-amino-2-deoxyglucuronate dehydrogenase
MRKVGIGIIGTGGIANMHAGAVKEIAEADIVAVCDIDEARAAAFAQRHGVSRVYGDSRELLGDPNVEAVLVCTPHPSHCPLAIQAAEAGKHVMVEKPLSVDLQEADRAIAAAKRANVKFGVIFQRRFWPAAQRARAAIDSGKLGRVILGDCVVKWWRDKAYYDRDAWRGTWAAEGGGVMVNQAVHAIDMFQWLMGPIDTVYGLWGNQSHPFIEVEDTAVAAIRLKNGALGVIETTVSTKPQLGSRISIHGENGASLSVLEDPEGYVGVNDVWQIPGEEEEAARLLAQERAGADFMYRTTTDPDGSRRSEHRGLYHGLQIRDFVRAIREDREPAVTAEEGRKAVEIILAIYESGRTGQPVKLPLDPSVKHP